MRYFVTILFTLFIVYSPELSAQFTPSPVVVSQETISMKGAIYYVHKVEKNQTIFSIAKAYNVSISAIIADNPDIKSGLREGATIYIKKADTNSVKSVIHIVRWYENLSAIARKYNLSEEELIAFNSLESNKIKTRQALRIPIYEEEALNSEDFKTEAAAKVDYTSDISAEEMVKKNENDSGKELDIKSYKPSRSHVSNVSLVLPIGSKNFDLQDGNNNYLDFYQGFLLAVEDLKEEGMSLNLKFIDLSDYSSGTILAQSNKLAGSDIIIGPILRNDVDPVLQYALSRNIPLVSPMDPKTETLLENSPGLFQVSTSLGSQQFDLIKNISPNNKVALIYEESTPDKELVGITKEILTNLGIKYSSLSYDVHSGRSISPQIEQMLSKESMNEVIVVSNSEAFVSDLLRNLNLLSSIDSYKITLYGTPRWRNFENVDINIYHSMNLHLSLQYYVDYTDENVKKFLSRYRALYGVEPTPYSFQAYDVAFYFLSALYHLGPDFSKDIDRFSRSLLQTDMRFARKGNNWGFENTTSRKIIYNPDYSIEISSFNR